MKKTILSALAIAGFAVTTGAQAQSTYTTGDSVLFFRSTAGDGAASSLLINLGTIGTAGSSYNGTAFFNSFNIDLSSSSSIVSQTFGTNWWNNPNLRWGVIGVANDTGSNLDAYSYRVSGITAPLNLSVEHRIALANDVDNATLYAFAAGGSTQGLINGTYRYGISANGYALNSPTVEVVTEPDPVNAPGVYVTNQVAQDSFVSYNEGADIAAYDKSGFGTILGGVLSKDITLVNSVNLYAANNTVDRVAGEITSLGAPAQFGTVTISGGVVQVVPEPSTYFLIGVASLILIAVYRRRNA